MGFCRTQDRHDGPSGGAALALPVIASPLKIRNSKSGMRRAAVLAGVHVLIALHIAAWWWTGRTVSPLEPSEAMEFSKHDVINAGFVFFAAAIAVTAVCGRFFCGWGCHLVALQDLARWLLGRLHLRPKPMRSRVLMAVPLVALVYMFVYPLAYRVLAGLDSAPQPQGLDPLGGYQVALTTSSFWATFPSWFMAGLTFLVCGFVIIYLLGSKGFCTYGCPYGAVFGMADQLATWRIRVTDACEGCGHCTAVCSSNVRVHAEVRDYGMVVDPGCMKCLDCVSVCPNDALYVGRGMPAIFARARVALARPVQWAQRLPWWVLSAAFVFAVFALFTEFENHLDWRHCAGATATCLLLMAVFRGKSSYPRPEYTFAEEFALGSFFLVTLFICRGMYISVPPLLGWGVSGGVPFLMALGVSAIAAYLFVQWLRLFYKPSLSLHNFNLKRAGRLTAGGWCAGVILLGAGLLLANAGRVGWHARKLDRAFAATSALRQQWFDGARPAAGSDAELALEEGAAHARAIPRWARAGHSERQAAFAWLLLMNGDEALFEATAREVLERDDVPALRLDLADHLAKSSRFGEARTHYDAVAAGGAGPPRASSRYARALAGAGDAAAAQGVLLQALQHHPASAELHYDQGVLMSSQGRFDLAEQSFRQALELSPSHLPARVNLAGVLCETGRFREGIVEFEKVLAADPQDDETHVLLARAHAQLGDTGAAHIHLQQAAAILERRLAGDARDAQRRVRLFNVCLMLQDWDRAAEQLQLVVQQHPELADQIAPLQQQLDAARREPDRSGAEP